MVLDIPVDSVPMVVSTLMSKATAPVTAPLILRSLGVQAVAVAEPVTAVGEPVQVVLSVADAHMPDGADGRSAHEKADVGDDPGTVGPSAGDTQPTTLPGQYIVKGGDARVVASGVETAAGPQLVEYKKRDGGCMMC